ncbi:ABC transporter substrate-binding protein [Flavobacteriaceae bacterium R38]|nr:ABC transporter substrate-binding protein [Flavobacteriaceae bacterium R38]
MKHLYLCIAVAFLLLSCQKEKKSSGESLPVSENIEIDVNHAKGFTVEKSSDLTIIKVTTPWPGNQKTFTYALIPREKLASVTLARDAYDAIVVTPVEKIVVTSTTHIPSLEALDVEDKLIGFPDTKYISSKKTRQNIADGKVKELGKNEAINTEVLIDLEPELVIGFSINDQNKTYDNIQKTGIPVVYNGDWVEETPLGKAEWIKFFAPFFNLEEKADTIFSNIESEYNAAVEISKKAKNIPTVMSGALYQDVWYAPAGDSWAAQFLADANCNYLWKATEGTGSLSLSIESVLEKGQDAEFWIGPSGYSSYLDLNNANQHNAKFNAFKNKKVFTFGLSKGSTGGLLYYELGPNRPDLILKDLIHIFHPELLPDHQLFFFKPLLD